VNRGQEFLKCRICGKQLSLKTDTTTDENGQSVHQECQIKKILERSHAAAK
jgi:hypothetical protein